MGGVAPRRGSGTCLGNRLVAVQLGWSNAHSLAALVRARVVHSFGAPCTFLEGATTPAIIWFTTVDICQIILQQPSLFACWSTLVSPKPRFHTLSCSPAAAAAAAATAAAAAAAAATPPKHSKPIRPSAVDALHLSARGASPEQRLRRC